MSSLSAVRLPPATNASAPPGAAPVVALAPAPVHAPLPNDISAAPTLPPVVPVAYLDDGQPLPPPNQPKDGQDLRLVPPDAPPQPPAGETIAPGQPTINGEPGELIPPGFLELLDVIESVERAYPLLEQIVLEQQVAAGGRLSAAGAFDLMGRGHAIATPLGFYQTYRNGLSLEKPLFHGGSLAAKYRIGDGNFEPWFGERETNEGGEFSVELKAPLLQNRRIDKRRTALFQAELNQLAVQPEIRLQLLEFTRLASQTYWGWVAAGQALEANLELLENARARVEQIEKRMAAGDLEKIVGINNDQLIATRETKVIEAERKLEQAAIKLSLFLRDAAGKPIVPDPQQVPDGFPSHTVPQVDRIKNDIATAIEASPALEQIEIVREQVRLDLKLAENQLLPKFDARLLASQDVGGETSSKGDKTPFKLEGAFVGEVPLQRSAARGKIEQARAKLAQLQAKEQFVVDKVTAAVQDAVSALEAASDRIEQASRTVDLSRQTLDIGRLQFDAGDIDLVTLNIFEQAVTDAELLLISARADYFAALADYRAALALDPRGDRERDKDRVERANAQ